MPASAELARVLASGERATFHGRPEAAVAVLEQALELAQQQGDAADTAAAGWLLGVALGAGGRYGAALTVLSPVVEAGGAAGAPTRHRLFAALASSTIASVHRQLGRHAVARDIDTSALALSGDADEAVFDAQLGLASDAVGLEDLEEATSRLEAALAVVPQGSSEWWRQRVRAGWVQAEVAMLDGRHDEAVEHAATAVARAEEVRAPRHVAKGLLILGLAHVSSGGGERGDADPAAAAVATLRRAATLAESLGTVPLVWPARALLGALLAEDDPQESARSLDAARAAVLGIAGDLPPGVRAEWLARPDVGALMGADARRPSG